MNTWSPPESTSSRNNCGRLKFGMSLTNEPNRVTSIVKTFIEFLSRHEQDWHRFHCRFTFGIERSFESFNSATAFPYYLLNQTLLKSEKKRILSDCRGNYIIFCIPFDVSSRASGLTTSRTLVSIETLDWFQLKWDDCVIDIIRRDFKGWVWGLEAFKGWEPLDGDLSSSCWGI